MSRPKVISIEERRAMDRMKEIEKVRGPKLLARYSSANPLAMAHKDKESVEFAVNSFSKRKAAINNGLVLHDMEPASSKSQGCQEQIK